MGETDGMTVERCLCFDEDGCPDFVLGTEMLAWLGEEVVRWLMV